MNNKEFIIKYIEKFILSDVQDRECRKYVRDNKEEMIASTDYPICKKDLAEKLSYDNLKDIKDNIFYKIYFTLSSPLGASFISVDVDPYLNNEEIQKSIDVTDTIALKIGKEYKEVFESIMDDKDLPQNNSITKLLNEIYSLTK